MQTEGSAEGLSRDELLDQEWDKLDEAEKAAGVKTELDGLSVNTDPEDSKITDAAKVAPNDSDVLKKESDQQESAEAKALKDTKAWATKLAQENSELKRLVAEGATKHEIEVQKKNVEGAKKEISDDTLATVYRDYPELKEVFSPLLDTLKELKAETDGIRKQKVEEADQRAKREKQEALDNFEKNILPEVMNTAKGGHADFKEIISNPSYFEWAEKQRPGLRTAALQSNDPEDIKWALTEYKKSVAGPEAAKMKQTEEEKRKEKLNNQMTLRGGSSSLSSGKGKTDPEDYDSAWEKAEAEERRNR